MVSYLNKSNIFAAFNRELAVRGVSPNTLKNYRSDIKLFSRWFGVKLQVDGVKTESLDEILPFLSESAAIAFKSFLVNRYDKKTVNRRLSSLRTLSAFLVESLVLDSDFMANIPNLGSTKDLFEKNPILGHFKKHLEEEKVSANTIKNYLSDVKHFLSWLETK